MTDLSIVIVNWNTRALLADCLTSVFATTGNLQIEALVVDNGSTDGSQEMVGREFPRVRLIQNNQNVGFACANNRAMRAAVGRYVLLLNSDVILRDGNLPALVRFADEHPQAAIVGATLINRDGTFQASLNDFPTPARVILESWGMLQILTRNSYYPSYPPHKSRQPVRCNWVGGACLLARQTAIRQVGLLDEQFFMNSEEVDWCLRMWQAGWEVWFTPEIEIVHLGGGSASRASAAHRLRLYESKARYLRKHFGAAAEFLARANYRLASGCKAALYGFRFVLNHDPRFREQAYAHYQISTRRSWC